MFARRGREWGCILYRGVAGAGAAVASTCRCGCSSEMFLFTVLAYLAVAAATNSTQHVTTDSPPESTTTKEILKASETADPSKVEIVKQIRRLNEDGSYTIGYEADDGTFKIESRDVLGNVKGTFGYIDQDGEIKRVTYSSSSDSTPTAVPVSTSTTPSPPAIVVRMNKTVSSTTRRPLPTVVYPSRTSYTTRGTVIQPIPRRRSGARTTTTETSTEKEQYGDTTSTVLNLYKNKMDESVKTRTQVLKPMPSLVKDDLITKQTTTNIPVTLKPTYEHVSEKRPETDSNKANTIRRELTGTSTNPRMVSLQQSVGDDSTDVYGSHLSLGTVRPLFTTTTPRPKLVPIQSLVAARQRIHQQYHEEPIDDQETNIEASTGRVFEQESVVTSNPVPVIHISAPREHEDRLYHQQPIYRRPAAAVQFRTHEYMRDNPGAPVPIGNQRPFLQYEYQNKVLEPQFIKETTTIPQTKPLEAESSAPYDARPVTRIIPVPVDERGVPLQGYQGRFINAYRQPPPPPQSQPVLFQPRYNQVDDMYQITAPVSTRDLRRLLQILILRQNRLQSLMDQMMPGPYQPLYRPEDYRYQQRRYEEDYDYRYEPREVYSNQVSSYENSPYESQRYIPRRRLYPRPYDTAGSSSNRIEETPEFLPPEIREALLLKMLVLAINPDFLPSPAPTTELTTAAPPRKQVRNVQILGEEGSMDGAKRPLQRH